MKLNHHEKRLVIHALAAALAMPVSAARKREYESLKLKLEKAVNTERPHAQI